MSSSISLWRKDPPKMTREECVHDFIEMIRPFGFYISHDEGTPYVHLNRSDDELWISPIFNIGLEDHPIATVNGADYYEAVYIECIGAFYPDDFEPDEYTPEDIGRFNLIRSDIIMKAVTAYMDKYPDSLFYVTSDTPFYDKQDIDNAAAQPLKAEWFYDMQTHLKTQRLDDKNEGWYHYRAEGLK